MKHSTPLALALLGGGLLTTCQKKDATPTYTREGYVIGFNPCSPPQNKGYVLAFPASSGIDTVVTYTLPATLYDFPPDLFTEFRLFYLFPSSEQTKYRVRVTYSFTPEKEKVYSFCTTDINMGDYGRAVGDHQVVIKQAQRLN